ncbi:helix-turn-helix domain-containing protein [Chitinophaga ginsengisoli]|uniref:AraC-like DNA-binding protein n=1 Tax=Chitinophaga ginsengisoli TaxID=363837 RepID=A0A2P8G2G1_9BACT|nr:helix-turn-helix domain-containing protein [Chitinophaga ginsengisoli]PSL28136.1 AraC-like DNA-binding protein [Chitinophaga ginsengisoli]
MEDITGYNSYRVSVPQAFEDVFSHFYCAENKSDVAIEKTLLPSYQTIMIFNFGVPASFISRTGDQITVETCIVLGPIKHAFNYLLPSGAEILVCNFKDDAFFRFFGNADITQEALHPDELLHKNCFTTLWSELKQISGNEKRIETILDFSKPYLRRRDKIAEQIAGSDRNAFSPIKEISQKNKLSERSVQTNHKKHFGYTSKEMYRYSRFLKAIEILQEISLENTKIDWFEIIDRCGYYDQSQLIKDFNHYLHLSPSKYLKFQESICNPKY